jgi:hypothetical protein
VVSALPVQDRIYDNAFSTHDDFVERAARKIRLRVAAVADGWVQARSRSAPSSINCCRFWSSRGGDIRAMILAIFSSIRCTVCKRP